MEKDNLWEMGVLQYKFLFRGIKKLIHDSRTANLSSILCIINNIRLNVFLFYLSDQIKKSTIKIYLIYEKIIPDISDQRILQYDWFRTSPAITSENNFPRYGVYTGTYTSISALGRVWQFS